jgi:DNA-binding CsgD family transcriptional regulator
MDQLQQLHRSDPDHCGSRSRRGEPLARRWRSTPGCGCGRPRDSTGCAMRGCENARVGQHDVGRGPTVREREICLLAAGGLSSKAIAERGFLSVRTVNNHLQSAYVKLGVSGRHELAGALNLVT